ncbi:MAG: protein kinase [Candidatus Zixiibacteriota bacterium]|nr:MAG: protein kinase [candidate division Zixibacteria bacterium]
MAAEDNDQTRSFTNIAAGTVVSHYRIFSRIGAGGMGEVYLAEDTKLDRKVALKFLPFHLCRDEASRARFTREAKAAAKLDHPNIVPVYEVGEFQERPFFAMAHIEGKSLREVIKEGKLQPTEAVNLAAQICDGLHEAHTAGVVHRDIKPSNIIIDKKNKARLLDFGLATVAGEEKLTKVGSTLGTVHYMSPEQARGDEVDHRSDIWSLGAVLYEMLTGKLPFRGNNDQSVIYSILNEEPRLKEEISGSSHAPLIPLLEKSLQKNVSLRPASVSEFKAELEQIHAQMIGAGTKRTGKLKRYLRPAFLIPVGLIVVIGTAFIVRELYRMNKIRWVRDVALPRIEELTNVGGPHDNNVEAYDLAVEAEEFIGDDPKLEEYMKRISAVTTIHTQPIGARIFRKPFNKPESDWEFIGLSPVDSMRMPNYLFHWKIENPGYETMHRCFLSRGSYDAAKGTYSPGFQDCVLDKKGSLPSGMVRISGTEEVPDFLIDKYEVSNEQYKEFVDAGGYQERAYWKQPFIRNGDEVSWETAIAEFKDATGRLGPSTWEVGVYPEGTENYPVSGISWYEAAAYAEFVGKELPTISHWYAARRGSLGGLSYIFYSMCNFSGDGPVPIGMTKAITQFGVYDMAGNVREWCWNASEKGRCIRGGAWDDYHYMYDNITQADPFDRSSRNGIRCVSYFDKDVISENVFAPRTPGQIRDFYKHTRVSDAVLDIYKDMFSYDRINLGATSGHTENQSAHWIHKTISFSAAYGEERIIIHLFLPKSSNPPYQTVIYFPGSNSVDMPSSDHIEGYYEFTDKLVHFLKDGRAVVYPVYKGTFERRDGLPSSLHLRYDESHEYRDYVTKVVKDFRRVIDYLETRPDIDTEKLAYFGFSWGGILGSIIPAVEKRIRVSIIDAGGLAPLSRETKPEVDGVNYVSRITIPTLMLHGRFDRSVSYDHCAKPMFDLLGTPTADKNLITYETDHFIPQKDLINESLAWLDRYFGPAR